MSNAVKTWTPKKHVKSTDDLGLSRVRYYVPQYVNKPFRESRPIVDSAVNMQAARERWETGGVSPQVALVERDK